MANGSAHDPTMKRIALTLLLLSSSAISEEIESDLLIVGGTESGWAAAIQAARMGIKSITLVHDGKWLGGQYTEQGLVCVDENKGNGKVGWGPSWNPMKRSFHRFGLFRELMDRIEAFNLEKYGDRMPGKPMHGPSTFRPAEAEAIFREMLQPYVESGQVIVKMNHLPEAALKSDDGTRVTGMIFRPVEPDRERLTVRAPFTIDASDWGDVVQLSGTAFEVGPDPRSQYGEPSAQEDVSANPPNEMNPITWTLVLVESDEEVAIAEPPHYDLRRYLRTTPFGKGDAAGLKWDKPVRGNGIPPWPPDGKAAPRQSSILTMRRIIEGGASKDGRTSALICYSHGQDYPLERLPLHVVAALEATEPGASLKNLVLMTREQRQIVFEDAKAQSLGLLYHLQTYVHERAKDTGNSLRHYERSDEFGTSDRLPPKPYIRESLRLKSLYMMREQDGLNTDGKSKNDAEEAFAKVMYPDGLFSWQFHYDFHDTGRTYLKDGDASGPWTHYEKPGRGVHNLSDRSVFPLRSLVPEEMNGLIGAQGNVGFSSIVSAAIRLHDQRIHIGQSAAALAAISLRHQIQPRDIAGNRERLEEVQSALCGGTEGVPMLLWPYRDLPSDHPAFVAINRLAARGLLPQSRRIVDFQPDAPATEEWRKEVMSLCQDYRMTPTPDEPLSRGDFARLVWGAIREQTPPAWPVKTGTDADGDGIEDKNDPLPYSTEIQSWPDKVK
jgi:hypothetical protein